MQQLIKKIFTPAPANAQANPSSHQQATVVCNYNNNYYGDQVCTLTKR